MKGDGAAERLRPSERESEEEVETLGEREVRQRVT